MIRSINTSMDELRSVEEMFDRLWNGRAATANSFSLPLEVVETQDHLIVRAPMPGVSRENLEITVENAVLTIKGESKPASFEGDVKVYRREFATGAYARSLRLPKNLDLDKIDAELRDGILTVTIAKLEETKPRTIQVQVRDHNVIPARVEA